MKKSVLTALVLLVIVFLVFNIYVLSRFSQLPGRVITIGANSTVISHVTIGPTASVPQLWTVMFNAPFESGLVTPYFNDSVITTCGAIDSVSSTVAHHGRYAEYDYYNGGACLENVRAYPTEALSARLADFYVEVWVYVPHVTLIDWVSFITLHLSDDTFITVDSNTRQELHLWNKISGITYQANPIEWPFDQWFKIAILAHLQPGTANSTITLYQDNAPIVTFTGDAGDGLLAHMHFGLYTGPSQGTFSVYNDDISLLAPTGN